MSTESTITVVHDALPYPAVAVEGHTVKRGEPTELPAELAERLLGDDVGWRRADSTTTEDADDGGTGAGGPSPYDDLSLAALRELLDQRQIEVEGRLTRFVAINLLVHDDGLKAASA